jgi:cell division septation protein DedD
MSEGQDTEITLGTGRLLGLFFGLVIVCALFFGLGFSMGRNSTKSSLTMEEAPSAGMPAQANAAQKVSPGTPEKPVPPPVADTAPDTATQNAQSNTPAPVVVSTPANSNSPSTTPAPEIGKGTSIAPAGGAYTVQVAAVSKQEDADALVSALKKKSYPVFIASTGTDKLLHVQIGPFNDIKDAESMKTKLTSDGYNPIVKR